MITFSRQSEQVPVAHTEPTLPHHTSEDTVPDDVMPYETFSANNPGLGITREQYYAAQTDEEFSALVKQVRKREVAHSAKKGHVSSGMSRREFLKVAGAAGIAVATKKVMVKFTPPRPWELDESEIGAGINETEATPNCMDDEQKDLDISSRHFMEQIAENGVVNIAEAKKAIYKEYKEKYGPDGSAFTRSIAGLQNQKTYLQEIYQAADAHRISHELLLAVGIGESYLENDAVSKSGAVGPWQIMKSTAVRTMKNLGKPLIVKQNIYDERRDTVKAAEAASKLLAWNRDYFDGDLDVGITGYNGWSLAVAYKKDATRTNRKCTYDDYNTWLQDNVNQEIAQLRKESQKTDSSYMVRSGDTLSTIAKHFNIPLATLLQDNALTEDSVIKLYQKIKLPEGVLSSQEIFMQAVRTRFASKWKENFVYPEKIRAIEAVLRENNILDNYPAHPAHYAIREVPQVPHHATFTVQRKDTLTSIAKKAKTSLNTNMTITDIITALRSDSRNMITGDKIRVGQKLFFTPQDVKVGAPLTLVAKALNENLGHLERLNPAIQDSTAHLPTSATLRIPEDALRVVSLQEQDTSVATN